MNKWKKFSKHLVMLALLLLSVFLPAQVRAEDSDWPPFVVESGPISPDYGFPGGYGMYQRASQDMSALWRMPMWTVNAVQGDPVPLSESFDQVSAPTEPMVLYVEPDGNCGGHTPCFNDIQPAVQAASDGDEIHIAAGTYTTLHTYHLPGMDPGVITQVVYITKSLVLAGGYPTDFSTAPDPDTYITTLDAQGQGRGIYIIGRNSSITITGLQVTGGDATKMACYHGCNSGDRGPGGGINALDAKVTISNCRIYGNKAFRGGGGVRLFNGNAELYHNTITSNTVSGSGGGLYTKWGVDITIIDNVFSGNTASELGGGLFIFAPHVEGYDVPAVVIGENVVSSNTAIYGGGMLLEMWNSAMVYDNRVLNNTAGYEGGGMSVWLSDEALLRGNLVQGNTANRGGGLNLWGSDAILEGNVVRENQSLESGGGIFLRNSSTSLRNNVVSDNTTHGEGSGIYIMGAAPQLWHTTLARNRGGAGVYVTGGYWSTRGDVTLVNTILVSHTVGVAVSSGNTTTLRGTLWDANTVNWGGDGLVTHTADIFAPPDFAADGYHLLPSSSAVDAGVWSEINAEMRKDIDGDARPAAMGYDLGADEVPGAALQVAFHADKWAYNAGETVVYSIRVRNSGIITARNISLVETLPANQRPLGISSTGIPCAWQNRWGGEAVCGTVDVAVGETFHITVTAEVTSVQSFTPPHPMTAHFEARGDNAAAETMLTLYLHDCHVRLNEFLIEYPTLQEAIDAAAPGDTIKVAGVCAGAEERSGLHQLAYISKTVTVRGGYAPDNWTTADPDAHPSLLDALGKGHGMYITGPITPVIEGLSVTGGDGGLHIVEAAATITNCHIYGNYARSSGGGIYLLGSASTLINNRILDNGTAAYGGGLYLWDSDARLIGNLIQGNTATQEGNGGGLALLYSDALLSRNIIQVNRACCGGGLMLVSSDATVITGNTVISNEASVGGGMDLHFESNVIVSNNIVRYNKGGGGVFIGGYSKTDLRNNVIADNIGFGGVRVWGAYPRFSHNTIARNQERGLSVEKCHIASKVTLTNTIIAGHTTGIYGTVSSTVTLNATLWYDNGTNWDGDGIIHHYNDHTGDPAFAPDGYHLSSTSAAVNAGVYAGVDTDIDGDPRPYGAGYDIGADESGNTIPVHLLAILSFDNNLSPYLSTVIERFRQGTAANPAVRATLLVDGSEENDTEVVLVIGGVVNHTGGVPWLPGVHELDTADPDVLASFLTWARETYPTEQEIVTLVGHGSGPTPEIHFQNNGDGPLAHVPPLPQFHERTSTDTSSGTYLSTPELGRALALATDNGRAPFDLLFLDSCFNGSLDVLYEIHDSAEVFIASPNYAWGVFAYDAYIPYLTPSATSEQMAESIITAYQAALDDNHPNALFWVRGDDIIQLAAITDNLADTLATSSRKDAILEAALNSRFVDTTLCQNDRQLCPPDELLDLRSFAHNLALAFNTPPIQAGAEHLEDKLDEYIHTQYRSGHPWIDPDRYWDFNGYGLTVLAPLTRTLTAETVWRASIYTQTTPLEAVWSPQPTRTVTISPALRYAREGRWDDFISAWYVNLTPTVGSWCHIMPPALVITDNATITLNVQPGLVGAHLNWSPVIDEEVVDYAIYIKRPGGTPWELLDTVPNWYTTYYDHAEETHLSGQYGYFVAAQYADGEIVALSAEIFVNEGVTAVAPGQGYNDVATQVYLHGVGFAAPLTVTLGGRELEVTYVDSGLVVVWVPAGMQPDRYSVSVVNSSGRTVSENAFRVVERTSWDDLRSEPGWIWGEPWPLRVGYANSSVGANIEHQGGKHTLDSVSVEFRLGDPQGDLLGTVETLPLPPGAISPTGKVLWEPLAAGTYTICLIIDPQNVVPETDETNNTICRTVTVLGGGADTVPPEVNDFIIEDDAPTTTDQDVSLDVTITDQPRAGASGVQAVKFIEFEYNYGAGQWIPIHISNWIDYPAAHQDYPWTLAPVYGMRYMQAWGIDRADNISLRPGADSINLLPTTQAGYVAQGGVVVYRIYLAHGEHFSIHLTPTDGGDPDLYVWGPDGSLWYSDNPSGYDDTVSLVAPLEGVYQVEVRGYAAAYYQLVFGSGGINRASVQPADAESKPIPTEPAIPLNEQPQPNYPNPPATSQEPRCSHLYLPLIVRNQ